MILFRSACIALLTSVFLVPTVGKAATVTKVQTFSGSHSNRATHTFGGVLISKDLIGAIGTGDAIRGSRFDVVDRTSTAVFLDQFDTSLGTLQSVTIRYKATSTGPNRLLLRSSSCTTVAGIGSCTTNPRAALIQAYGLEITGYTGTVFDGDVSYFSPYRTGFGVFGSLGLINEGLVSAVDVGQIVDTAADSSRPVGEIPSGAFEEAVVTLTPGGVNFDKFIGVTPGALVQFRPIVHSTSFGTVECISSGFGAVIADCDAQFRAFYDYSFEASVTYTYDDGITPPRNVIPLPAGFPMLLGGLALLGILGRRRQS